MVYREVGIMKLLSHPHIIRLFEVIDTEKYLFLVMEYAAGGEVRLSQLLWYELHTLSYFDETKKMKSLMFCSHYNRWWTWLLLMDVFKKKMHDGSFVRSLQLLTTVTLFTLFVSSNEIELCLKCTCQFQLTGDNFSTSQQQQQQQVNEWMSFQFIQEIFFDSVLFWIEDRDLKAENLLLDSNMNIKVIDFGLSNCFVPGSFMKTFCGSPTYTAPELIQRKKYTQSRPYLHSLNGFFNSWLTFWLLSLLFCVIDTPIK